MTTPPRPRRKLPVKRPLAGRLVSRLLARRRLARRRPAPRTRAGGPPAELCAAEFLRGTDIVVVDVETTGWLDDDARITEIGAVKLSAGQPIAEFSTLVNPGVPIPVHITELTGITDVMVRDAPVISEVLPRFLEFADGSVIAAHNAPFDVGFLTAACHACGMSWPPRAVVDTAVLSRMVLGPGDVPDHKLSTLASHFAVKTDPCHRALADARATLDVLAGLLALLAGSGAAARAPHSEPRGAVPPRLRRFQAVGLWASTRGRGTSDKSRRRPEGALRRAGRRVLARLPAASRYDGAAAGARVPGEQEAAMPMVTAIVLIKADVARIPETAQAIAQIEQVSEVYSVTGEFDLVAMVRVRDHDELGDVIPGTLNRVPGVTHTETHIAFRTYSRHDLEAAFALGYPDSA